MNNSKNIPRSTFLKQAGIGLGVLFSGGIMQTFQSCTKPETIAPVDTLTPLQAAKNAMRTKLESQYGSIEKLMEKGITIVSYMTYPDTQSPEQFYGTQIYNQITNPASVIQLNQMVTNMLQPYMKGIKINIDFQLLPLTKDDISGMIFDPNDTSKATISRNASMDTALGKKLNADFIEKNKTKMKNGDSMSSCMALFYDTDRLGVKGITGGSDLNDARNEIKYNVGGINIPLNDGFLSILSTIIHEVVGHGFTEIGNASHTQNSRYIAQKKTDGSYGLIATTNDGAKRINNNDGSRTVPLSNGGNYIIKDSEILRVYAINQNGTIQGLSSDGGIMIGGTFDPKIVGDVVIGYKLAANGSVEKKIDLKLPDVAPGFALPDTTAAVKNSLLTTAGGFITSIVNDVRVG